MSRTKEIVGIITNDNVVTNIPRIIMEHARNNTVKMYLDREAMKLMASFDLGRKWERLASGPTLFLIEFDDHGEVIRILPPEDKERVNNEENDTN